MTFLSVASGIWSRLVSIFGTVFLFTALLSFAISLIGRFRFRKKKTSSEPFPSKEKNQPGADSSSSSVRKIAVITGASSGLGSKYALAVDKDSARYDINEFWLIARRKDRMEELAQKLSHRAVVLPADLSDPDDIHALENFLHREKEKDPALSVSILLNCAGYGKYGRSSEIGHEAECRMIDVNDKAAITVTDIFVPFMTSGSRIGEICSVAAFQPIPGFNCYAASKSLLYSYSRALRMELAGKGISVTAVCPYWVRDTEFIETAAGGKKRVLFSSRSDSVVRLSLRDLRCCHAVSTPGIISTLDRIFAGLIPDGIMGWIASKCL